MTSKIRTILCGLLIGSTLSVFFARPASALSDAEWGEQITACFYPSARFTKVTYAQPITLPSSIVSMSGAIEFIDPQSQEERYMSFNMELFSTLSGGTQFIVTPYQYTASSAPNANCAMSNYWQPILR